MDAQFQYEGFEPGEAVKHEAEVVLAQISELEPEDSTLIARAEFDGNEYACSIDIFDERGSEYVFVTHSNPVTVIRSALEKIKRQLSNKYGNARAH